jgi:hypothetical protein
MTKKVDAKVSPAKDAWRAHNLSQLLYFQSLSLREKFEAVEGMAEIVRLLERMRANDGSRAAPAEELER